MKWLIVTMAMPFVGVYYLVRYIIVIFFSTSLLIYFICRYGVNGADKRLDEIIAKLEKEEKNSC